MSSNDFTFGTSTPLQNNSSANGVANDTTAAPSATGVPSDDHHDNEVGNASQTGLTDMKIEHMDTDSNSNKRKMAHMESDTQQHYKDNTRIIKPIPTRTTLADQHGTEGMNTAGDSTKATTGAPSGSGATKVGQNNSSATAVEQNKTNAATTPGQNEVPQGIDKARLTDKGYVMSMRKAGKGYHFLVNAGKSYSPQDSILRVFPSSEFDLSTIVLLKETMLSKSNRDYWTEYTRKEISEGRTVRPNVICACQVAQSPAAKRQPISFVYASFGDPKKENLMTYSELASTIGAKKARSQVDFAMVNMKLREETVQRSIEEGQITEEVYESMPWLKTMRDGNYEPIHLTPTQQSLRRRKLRLDPLEVQEPAITSVDKLKHIDTTARDPNAGQSIQPEVMAASLTAVLHTIIANMSDKDLNLMRKQAQAANHRIEVEAGQRTEITAS